MINIMKLKMDHRGRITIPKGFREVNNIKDKSEVIMGTMVRLNDYQVVMEFTPKEDTNAT